MPFITARVVSVIRTDAIAAAAFAGDDQSVLCASLVQLQGQILGDDAANHTFEWVQTSGDPIAFINPNTLNPSFLASGGSDIEITLYVDRGTPYEASDTILISATPTTTMRGAAQTSHAQQNKSASAGTFAAFTSSGMGLLDSVDLDFKVGAYSYNYPPDATYSPIYKAEDLVRIKDNLTGNYWLMRDIDLSDYDNWDPIGTATKPFSGELQGNGFKIENLSISSDSILIRSADPYIDNVTLMVSGETAADGSTTFTSDVGGKTFDSTVTHVTTGTGVATVSNAQSKFGSNSIYVFDETGGANNAGFGTTTSTDFDFGSGDFTIEYHWQTPDINVSTRDTIGMWDNSSLGWKINHLTSAALSNWSITFSVSTDGTSNNLTYANAETYTGALNTWIHIAVSRVGNTMYYFADGNLIGTKDVTGLTIFAGTSKFYLGTATLNGPNYELYMDNVRLTKGVGRYTTSFTPPSNPFPVNDVVGDVGLFSRVGNGAVIENVGVTNANISGVSNTVYKGILAGSAQGPSTDDGGAVTVRDVYVTGDLNSGGGNAGGLIGHTGTNVSTIIENTYADVNVTEVDADPLFSQVQFLASFDGSDLSQTYSEQSQNALAGTFQTGSSRIRTTEFYSSPSSYNNNSGTARLEFPNDAALQLGSGDFCIEFFLYFNSITGGNTFIAGHYGTSGNRPWALLFDAAAGPDWLVRLNGSTVADFTPTTPIVTGKWYHVVLERNSNAWQLGVDGIRENSGALVGTMQTSDDVLTWGGNFNSGPVSFLNGYIDDARITIGSSRYDLGGNETYNIPETPFAAADVSASVAGWAGNFQTEATYNNNYWNTSKIAQGTGTGGDTPIAGEVDGLSNSELQSQGNYTNWNFDTVWQMPVDIAGPAQLQNNIFDRVADEGAWLTTGLPQAALWNTPEISTGGNIVSKNKQYTGLIIEDQNPATNGWENRRFIPYEQQSALLTPGRRHRAFTVLNIEQTTKSSRDRVREVTYKLPRTIVPKTETGSHIFAGGTSAISGTMHPSSASVSKNLSITIVNPRKISKSVEENAPQSAQGSSVIASATTLTKYTGLPKLIDTALTTEASAVLAPGGGTFSENLVITRSYGGSIGGA